MRIILKGDSLLKSLQAMTKPVKFLPIGATKYEEISSWMAYYIAKASIYEGEASTSGVRIYKMREIDSRGPSLIPNYHLWDDRSCTRFHQDRVVNGTSMKDHQQEQSAKWTRMLATGNKSLGWKPSSIATP